jgi:RimJ/RimL family protein N-acetyltransferase
MPPVIETARLRLRAHTPDDFEACAAMWGSPEVTRYIGGRPFTREEVWSRILRYVGHWQWMNYGFWAIEEKETGLFVGEAGFAEFHRQIEPSLRGIPEIGWALFPGAHGKGYATEAIRAVTAWGDEHFTGKTACMIDPGNAASLRVAEKCGYQVWTHTTYHGHPTILHQRPRGA